ncbi:hypothetical protein [Aliiroseovarius marinus]|uniref:hypothetical protein n=1 Tax=Aliiroseovarius marinus TaxID=2500159 RepID=UPI00248FA021|nr:hypothetical protein [Aliiroseovarius marinus]
MKNSLPGAAIAQLAQHAPTAIVISLPAFAYSVLTETMAMWMERAAYDVESAIASVGFLLGIVGFIAYFAIFGAMAVAWHRFILCGEDPIALGLLGAPRRLISYAIQWFVLGVIVFIPVMIILLPFIFTQSQTLILEQGEVGLVAGSVFVVAPYAIGGVLILRFGLKLVAIATDAHEISFRDSWRITRPHSMSVLLAGLLLGAVAFLVYVPAELIVTGQLDFTGSDPMGGWLLALIDGFGVVLLALLEVAFLTELYRRCTTPNTRD